jgi:hypothetical protein
MVSLHLRRAALVTGLLLLTGEVPGAPPPASPTPLPRKETHALFGVGAQPCQTFLNVVAEANGNQIALSGAMFSWAQGWFSARNIIGHESAPLAVGGKFSVEALKGQLADECRAHPEEPLYLAVNDLYVRLAAAPAHP